MRRHLGSASLAGGLVSWAAFLFALVLGGLDPSPGRAPMLRVAMMAASGVAVLALCAATVAIVRGPGRVRATFGLMLSVTFLLSLTGLGFALAGLLRHYTVE